MSADIVAQQNDYDVVVIGGGAAGLGGALTLARARRTVLVIDDGTPRNAKAARLHGFLSRDGAAPGDLLAAGRAEVTGYGGTIRRGTVSALRRRDDGGFEVRLQDGSCVSARRLLVTTGLTDELPDVPGVAERFGRDVLHCPYCHGWEVRDQPIAVLGGGPMSVHQAQLFRQWSPDVTLLLHTGPAPTDEEREQLAARGITVVTGEVRRLEITGDQLTGVRLADGRLVGTRALVVGPVMSARATVLSGLGLTPSDLESGGRVFARHIAADPSGLTSVPGVWVAGNIVNASLQLIGAAAGGVQAAAAINADLIAEEISTAVTVARSARSTAGENGEAVAGQQDPFSPASEAALSARLFGDRRHGLLSS